MQHHQLLLFSDNDAQKLSAVINIQSHAILTIKEHMVFVMICKNNLIINISHTN